MKKITSEIFRLNNSLRLKISVALVIGIFLGVPVFAQQTTNRPDREQQFMDMGFGMFIHWSMDSQVGAVISHSMAGASADYLDRFVNELPKTFRKQDRFEVRKKNIDLFYDEIVPFWKGKTLEESIKKGNLGQKIKRTEKVLNINQKNRAQGHIIPDLQGWLESGPAELLIKFQTALRQASGENKKTFLESVCISLKDSLIFMRRYADLALQLAGESSNDQTKAHFTEIAGICRKLTVKNPDTFHKAVQSVWFLFVLLHLQFNASSFSPSRIYAINNNSENT